MQGLKVARTGMERFRRRARKAYLEGKEYIEMVGGQITPTGILIQEFFSFPHKASKEKIHYEDADWNAAIETITAKGMVFLGSIHSHPNKHSHPSEEDLHSSRRAGEHLLGIIAIWRSETGRLMTKTEWWPNHHPYRVEIYRPA